MKSKSLISIEKCYKMRQKWLIIITKNFFMYNEEYSSSEISGCFFLRTPEAINLNQKADLNKKMENYKNF